MLNLPTEGDVIEATAKSGMLWCGKVVRVYTQPTAMVAIVTPAGDIAVVLWATVERCGYLLKRRNWRNALLAAVATGIVTLVGAVSYTMGLWP